MSDIDQTKPSEPKIDENFAKTIDKDDPHKVEKLANAGKDEDASESSE